MKMRRRLCGTMCYQRCETTADGRGQPMERKGPCWVVALRERWRECSEMGRRNGVRLALTDEEAKGMLQFDSSNSVCSCVVLCVHSARHPDNTNNNISPNSCKERRTSSTCPPLLLTHLFGLVWNAQQPLPVLNPAPHPLI